MFLKFEINRCHRLVFSHNKELLREMLPAVDPAKQEQLTNKEGVYVKSRFATW